MTLSRRALLLGGGAIAVLGIGAGVEAGRIRHGIDDVLHPVPEPSYSVPAHDARIVSGSFTSAARAGRIVGWSVAYPPGPVDALPVVVVLHGRGDSHATTFGSHAWGRYLVAGVAAGVPAFAVAAVDGGDHGYWHRRRNADNPQRMLVDEFLPLLETRGLRTDRIGLAGWSMGGYGALLLAEVLGVRRVSAIAVDSPALWTTAGAAAPGAFDDASDYARNDVFAGRARLNGIPLRIAIGTSDPFYRASRTFVSGLPEPPTVDFSKGGHDVAFWRHSAPAQIAFLGHHLHAP